MNPVKAREFACEVVQQLRDAGHVALWAGGCVRDSLMGREPKDYDVATDATPDRIREVFGRRRTVAIGMSFGVITVVGSHEAGQIDVATFRRDAAYTDGRHPDSVAFSTPEEDARRRDFTINGLFFDPVEKKVIDYVGGQEDLNRCVVRAIGDPAERFAEDRLRMIRAVRFSANLGFALDPATMTAIRQHAAAIRSVSAERVTEEMRRMLLPASRARAVELLRDTMLLHEILPDAEGILPRLAASADEIAFAWDRTLRVLDALDQPDFAVAFAALLREIQIARRGHGWDLDDVCRRWRLANDDRQRIDLCYRHEEMLRRASQVEWPRLQRVLIDPGILSLLRYTRAVAIVHDGHTREVEYCCERLAWPAERLNPAPLINGDDLRAAGIPPGPAYKRLLERVRDAQLLGEIATPRAALEFARRLWDAQASP